MSIEQILGVLGPSYHLIPASTLKEAGLCTRFTGKPAFWAHETGSTNTDAKNLLDAYPAGDGDREHPLNGVVLLADSQTGGRGRLGRSWSSGPGGLYFSLILVPNVSPHSVPGLSIVAGLAVAGAIRETSGLPALIKWPNDVYLDSRKVCGILPESRSTAGGMSVVIGTGVNVENSWKDLPLEVRDLATSVWDQIPPGQRRPSKMELLASVLNRLEEHYLDFVKNGLSGLLPAVEGILAFKDRPVVLRNVSYGDASQVGGVFRGLDKDGRALIDIPGEGIVPFASGDVSLRPVSD